MFSILKRLFAEPLIEERLMDFGGEETPYSALSKQKPGEARPEEGEAVVFSGCPTGRTFSCDRGSRHRPLRGKEAQELSLLITAKDDSYFLKSRGSYLLRHSQRGRFHYFTGDLPGAFVKIVEMDGRFRYAEAFTYSMVSFILWGDGDALNIKRANQAPDPTRLARIETERTSPI